LVLLARVCFCSFAAMKGSSITIWATGGKGEGWRDLGKTFKERTSLEKYCPHLRGLERGGGGEREETKDLFAY